MEKRRSYSNLTIVIAVVLGVGFVASAYLNFVQYQRSQQDQQLLHGTITDLRYQLGLDEKALAGGSTPTPKPSTAASPTPTPSATPAVLGDAATPTPTPAARTAVTNGFVHMRSAPNISASIVANLNGGTPLTLGDYADAKYQQVTAGGQNGYVAKSYITY